MALGVVWPLPHSLLQTSLSVKNDGEEPVESPRPAQVAVQTQGGNAVRLCSTEVSRRVLKKFSLEQACGALVIQ